MKKISGKSRVILFALAVLVLFASLSFITGRSSAGQNDYIISDDSGAAVLADMTSAFQALASHNLGTAAPATKYQGMTWIDSNASPWLLKRWDGSDWITEAAIDATGNIITPYVGAYPANGDHFRNRLANGDVDVDQVKSSHASGASMTILTASGWMHGPDTWQVQATGANITGQQITGITPYRHAWRFTGAASCTAAYFMQRIPGEDVQDLVGLVSTLQAYISSSGSLTVTWKAYTADAANNFTAVTQFATGTFSTTASPTLFTAEMTMPANAYNGVQIEFSIGAFASGTWTITGVQLEKGAYASAFELLPPERNLLRCQRQYVVIDEFLQSPAAGNAGINIPFPTQMRATPGAVIVIASGTATSATILTEAAINNRACQLQIEATSPGGNVISRVVAYSAML